MARGGRRGRPRVQQAAPAEIVQRQATPDVSTTRDSDGTVHAKETQVKTSIPSYASMDDPNEGNALGFIPQIKEYARHPFEDRQVHKRETMLKYARMLVEMHIDGPFLEYIEFANEKDILLRQKVHYEWLPIKCTYCKMFGHTQELCKKNDTSRKEWRVKTYMHTLAPTPQPEQQATDDTEGFQYKFQMIVVNDQMIHEEAVHLSTNKTFLITFIYGRNQDD
ncbi:hypothetical protein Cgig2_013320 [Carnegiea gigantea]|uniref:DUF4283 domain-containing protein n=1 Tax=Carnegiea gigantea TaxID=171969 RepID=A0A9Q1JE31_9CARY|nr:hypothetical protein Cgig2_013320 [Carnegiea gigantea]